MTPHFHHFDNTESVPSEQSGIEAGSWSACRTGEIQVAVNSLRQRRRRQHVLQSATVGASLLVLLTVGLWSIPDPPEVQGLHQKMSCRDVLGRAEDYVAGRLSDFVQGNIRLHLTSCEKCRVHINSLQVSLESHFFVPPAVHHLDSKQQSLFWSRSSGDSSDAMMLAIK